VTGGCLPVLTAMGHQAGENVGDYPDGEPTPLQSPGAHLLSDLLHFLQAKSALCLSVPILPFFSLLLLIWDVCCWLMSQGVCCWLMILSVCYWLRSPPIEAGNRGM